MLGNLIGGFIVIIVGTSLIGTVADNIKLAQDGPASQNGTNVTGAASTILGLSTLFFAMGIMTAGISLAIGGLRNAGLV